MSRPDQMPDVAGWNDLAGAYAEFAEADTALFAGPMLAAAAIRPGERALDVAAGTGALTIPLLATGVRVTAIDWSPAMTAHLVRRVAAADPAGGHRVETMDGQALTLGDGAFDVALSLFGVMLFPDFRAGLAEMARVLRPGGRCVLGVWADYSAAMQLLNDAVAAALPDYPAPQIIGGMAAMATPDGIAAELTRAGLAGVRTELVTRPWTRTRAQLARSGETIYKHMPPWPSLDEDQRERVLARMRDIAERDAREPFTSTAHVAVAIKL